MVLIYSLPKLFLTVSITSCRSVCAQIIMCMKLLRMNIRIKVFSVRFIIKNMTNFERFTICEKKQEKTTEQAKWANGACLSTPPVFFIFSTSNFPSEYHLECETENWSSANTHSDLNSDNRALPWLVGVFTRSNRTSFALPPSISDSFSLACTHAPCCHLFLSNFSFFLLSSFYFLYSFHHFINSVYELRRTIPSLLYIPLTRRATVNILMTNSIHCPQTLNIMSVVWAPANNSKRKTHGDQFWFMWMSRHFTCLRKITFLQEFSNRTFFIFYFLFASIEGISQLNTHFISIDF